MSCRWEGLDLSTGRTVAAFEVDGVPVRVMMGYGALCAYVGVPDGHPLAGIGRDMFPVKCHGGWNYATGERPPDELMALPEGWHWFGWSYDGIHDGTTRDFDAETGQPKEADYDRQLWTVSEVTSEAWSVAYEFAKLARLAEELAMRALGWRRAIEATEAKREGDGTI